MRTETEQMKIKKNLVYTIKEASSLTGISTRTLSRTAKKHNLERIDNRYVFTGDFILETFKKQLKKVASPKKMARTMASKLASKQKYTRCKFKN